MKKIILVIIAAAYAFFIYRTEMYTIKTSSMEPIFKAKSVVLVDKKFKFEKLKVGDIIAYNNGYDIIIHRVMEIKDGKIKTRGDSNTTMDGSEATKETYLGKYICNFDYLGNAIIFLRSFKGFVTIVAIILISILLKKPYRRLKRKIKNAL